MQRRRKMKNWTRFGFTGIVAVGLAWSATKPALAQGGADGSFERTLNVAGMINLDVSTGSGSIDLKRGAGNRVEIRGRIRVGNNFFRSNANALDVVRRLESNPPIEQNGQTI